MIAHHEEKSAGCRLSNTAIAQDRNRSNAIKRFFTCLKLSRPVPESHHSPIFRVRRDSIWVDPAEPLLATYIPASPPPADHQSYAAWLYQHHAEEKLLHIGAKDLFIAGSCSSSRSSTVGASISSSSPPKTSVCESSTIQNTSHPLPSRKGRTWASSQHTDTGTATTSWWRPFKQKEASEPTFRVWTPYPSTSSRQTDPSHQHPLSDSTPSPATTQNPPMPLTADEPPAQGRWVAYPSILLSETPQEREERLRWERTFKPRRGTRGRSRVRWWVLVGVVVVGIVVVVVWIPVLLIVEGRRKGRSGWMGVRGRWTRWRGDGEA